MYFDYYRNPFVNNKDSSNLFINYRNSFSSHIKENKNPEI